MRPHRPLQLAPVVDRGAPDSYVARDNRAATRKDTQIERIPQLVAVVSRLLGDQVWQNLSDALRNPMLTRITSPESPAALLRRLTGRAEGP